MRSHIGAQQLVSRRVTEHPHHGIIYVHKAPIRSSEKQPFLNAIEKFPVAALRLAPVGNVLQHVNGANVIVGKARGSRGGDQKNAVGRDSDVFFADLLGVPAKWARQITAGFRDLPQAGHGFADQRDRWHAEMR